MGSFLSTYTHLFYDGRIIDANTSYRHSVEDIDFSPDGSVMGVGLEVYGALLIDTTDGLELKAGADEVLEEFAQNLYAALPEAKITFIGHTDSWGDVSSNLQLSIDRATAVK